MVGSHLLFELTKERARKVRAIYRKEGSLESVKRIFTDLSVDGEQQFATIEWVKADLDDIPALEAAFRDVVFVFHCAGFISYAPNDFDKLINGTNKISLNGKIPVVHSLNNMFPFVNNIGGNQDLEGKKIIVKDINDPQKAQEGFDNSESSALDKAGMFSVLNIE